MLHTPPEHARSVKVFKNRRNQAVRIPMDFALDADTVRIHRDGKRLILLEPVPVNRLLALLDSWEPLDEGLPEIAGVPVVAEEIF